MLAELAGPVVGRRAGAALGGGNIVGIALIVPGQHHVRRDPPEIGHFSQILALVKILDQCPY